MMEVRACTVAEHWEGEAAWTTRGWAVRTNSHRMWRCSSRGNRTVASSVLVEREAVTAAPEQVTVSWYWVWSPAGGRWSWMREPSTGRVRWSPGVGAGHRLTS